MFKNIILNTDSYKASHFLQYPEGTEYLSSYIESRGGRWEQTVVFGLQAFLKEYLSKPISQEDIDEAEEFWTAHGLPFNREGWQHILREHNGYLPVEVQAVPEGTVLENHNVMAQIRNTDPNVPWLTSYLETALLRAVWYPSTVATNSYHIKSAILDSLCRTSEDPSSQIGLKVQDFGSRGVSSTESAALGGMAHLVNFMGTDTVLGVLAARKYYGEEMAGFSIPASEHSTITAWGKDNELKAFENMLDQFAKPGALVACVSDSYDIYRAVNQYWGQDLKEKVEQSGATLVVRPDSGKPEEIVPEIIGSLMETFGYTMNRKGFKVLPSCVRVIQGDGINEASIKEILREMERNGQSADNIVFGMGGDLLQNLSRDTLKFAMKASAIWIDGQWQDVYKDPVTDPGKVSKAGRLALIESCGIGRCKHMTVREKDLKPGQENVLRTVFRNGEILEETDFKSIRERASQ